MTPSRKQAGVAFWAIAVVAVALIVAVEYSWDNGPPDAALTEEEFALTADMRFFVIDYQDESPRSDRMQQKDIDEVLGIGCELLDDIIVEDGKMHRIMLRLPDTVSPEDVVDKLRTMRGVARAQVSSLVC